MEGAVSWWRGSAARFAARHVHAQFWLIARWSCLSKLTGMWWSLLMRQSSLPIPRTWLLRWRPLQPFCRWAALWLVWCFFQCGKAKPQRLRWSSTGSSWRTRWWKEDCQCSIRSKSCMQNQTVLPKTTGTFTNWLWQPSTHTLEATHFSSVLRCVKES